MKMERRKEKKEEEKKKEGKKNNTRTATVTLEHISHNEKGPQGVPHQYKDQNWTSAVVESSISSGYRLRAGSQVV